MKRKKNERKTRPRRNRATRGCWVRQCECAAKKYTKTRAHVLNVTTARWQRTTVSNREGKWRGKYKNEKNKDKNPKRQV
jgi:hypothetical protein